MKSADKAFGWNETPHDILCGARSPFLLAAYANECCEEQKCPFSRTEKAVRKALNPKEDDVVILYNRLYENVTIYNINTIKGNIQYYLYSLVSLITLRETLCNRDTHFGNGYTGQWQYPTPSPPSSHLSSVPPSSHLLPFPGSECGCPTGNSSSSIRSATQYPLFKGIHCRLIGITWLEMLTLVFLNKVSINL